MARIVGNDGVVSFGTHSILANAWSISISRVVSDVTAYGDGGTRVVGGMPSYTGSVSGFLEAGAADTSPELTGKFYSDDVVAVTLTAATGCTYTCSTCHISGASVNVSKTGDTTISFDFTASGGFVESWN